MGTVRTWPPFPTKSTIAHRSSRRQTVEVRRSIYAIQTLDEIIDDLGKAIAWFQSIGLPTHETRLQAIHHYLFDQINFPDPDARLPEYDHYSVINDAAAFALIATECSKLPSNLLPRRTLRDALYGPLPPSNEDAQSSDSRNKFFELELAAHLSLAGSKTCRI